MDIKKPASEKKKKKTTNPNKNKTTNTKTRKPTKKTPNSPRTKMNQPQNPAEHLHHWPTLPSFLTKNGECCRAGDLPAHLQHPFTGTDQLSFSGLIVAALITPLAPPHPAVGHSCPPPPLCTVGHRMFLRSFVRLQGLRS